MKTTLMFAGLSVALALSVSLARPALAATDTRPSTTSTTCPDKQTTTTREVSTSTTQNSTTTSEPSTTTSVESSTTTTTAPVTTTTFASTTTAPSAPTTVTTTGSTTTVEATTTTVADEVTLIPATTIDNPTFGATGEISELPNTGTFPFWNVALFGVGILALGCAGELIRRMARS